MANPVEISTDNLNADIEIYTRRGYRLDMIFPADSPRVALMSRNGESVRLESVVLGPAVSPRAGGEQPAEAGTLREKWIAGRAGMEYRDLIPDRLGGSVIASHIRLTNGGEVPDYVHYHKVDFQMIYCKRGRIRVVYEDQGEPFWLETGDCVIQPPEIRHRVLECTAGAEVIEISMPAEHETWVEHAMDLPNSQIGRKREFSGHRFLRFQESFSQPFVGSGYVQNKVNPLDEEVSITVESFVDPDNNSRERAWFVGSGVSEFVYVLQGEIVMVANESLPCSFEHGKRFCEDDSFFLPEKTSFTFDWSSDAKLLNVRWPCEDSSVPLRGL